MMSATNDTIGWLLKSGEPWTRYRTLVDLLDRPKTDPEVLAARGEMLADPLVQGLLAEVGTWPGGPIKRHNDAAHPIHKLAVLADFGLRADAPGLSTAVETVLAHQSPEGAFQSVLNVAPAFGGTGEDTWAWTLCDAPTLVYALAAFGLGDDVRVRRALEHLAGLVADNGWRCVAAPELGRFRGPGRKSDPCPIANVLALKALAQAPGLVGGPAARAGVEALLQHWAQRGVARPYLFGIGSDFGKLKYPFVWYDVLHAADVLSRYALARSDPRFQELVSAVTTQVDQDGRFTPGSMYRAWQGWSFADKKHPSPWLTFLVLRLQRRASAGNDL